MFKSTDSSVAKLAFAMGMWLLSFVAVAQTKIGGTVKSSDGSPIPGANVVVKGTTVGTVSGGDGMYSITLNQKNAILVFSSIGFQSKEVAVGNNSTIDVTLTEDVSNLQEVVVTGLASSIKRSNLANAVATISAKELMGTTQIQTVDNAFYGKLAGVNMNTNGGAPGGGVSIQLRGISSLVGASQPLYIIDGGTTVRARIPGSDVILL